MLLLVALCFSQIALAETFDFDIPAQPLNTALQQLSVQSGYFLAVDSTLIQDFTSLKFKQSASVEDALATLLTKTGLVWHITENKSIIIERHPSNELIIPTIEVVASKKNVDTDSIIMTAGSNSFIGQEEIERFRGTSIGDVFQGESGVLVAENRNSGGLDINIRGMQGQGRVPVLLDGSRQETTVYRGYAGVSSRTYIDPDLISNIKINKGPSMSAQGTGATGGIVSMRTIGVDDILKAGQTFGMRLKGSLIGNNAGTVADAGTVAGLPLGSETSDGFYWVDCVSESMCKGERNIALAKGSKDTLNRPSSSDLRAYAGSLAIAKRFENIDIIAAYARREQGNYYAGKYGPIPHIDLSKRYNKGFYVEVRPKLIGASRFRAEEMIVNSNIKSTSLLLKGIFYLPNDHSFELGVQRYTSHYGQLMPSQLMFLGRVEQTAGSNVEVDTYISRYRYNPIDNDIVDVRFNVWNTHTKSINRNYSENMINPFFTGTPEEEKYLRLGGELSNHTQLLQRKLGLRYGVTYQQEKIGSEKLDDKFASTTTKTVFISGRNGSRKEYSAFLNLQLNPIKPVTVNLGTRYTKFTSQDERTLTKGDKKTPKDCNHGNSGACSPPADNHSFSDFAPLVSVQYDFLSGMQVYLRYAQAVRMPSLFEATSGFSSKPSFAVKLKPEHAYNKEIGLNIIKSNLLFKDDKLKVKLALFNNITKDYLTRTSPNVWEKDPSVDFFVTRNIDSVELHGKEFYANYDAQSAYIKFGMTLYDKVEVCHYGSYRRQRCNNYGVANSYFNNMIPPNTNTTATLGIRLFKQQFELGLRGIFMGTRNRTPEYNDDTKKGFLSVIPWHKYEVYDFFASYQYKENIGLNFNIDNLTDRYYLDALSLGMVPAPGRTVRLSSTLKF